jgi:hypothetical protein
MSQFIAGNQEQQYRVLDAAGNVLYDGVSLFIAENYKASLPVEHQAAVRIVPIAGNGNQVLFG